MVFGHISRIKLAIKYCNDVIYSILIMSLHGQSKGKQQEGEKRIYLNKAQSARSLQHYRREHSRKVGSVGRQSSNTWEDDQQQEFTVFINDQSLNILKVENDKFLLVRSLARECKLVSLDGSLYFAKEYRNAVLSELERILYTSNRIQNLLTPSLIQIFYYKIFGEDGVWKLCFYMEYVPCNLQRYLASLKNSFVAFSQKSRLIFKIGRALYQLHSLGEHHGNLKKSKILVTEQGAVRINCAIQRRRKPVAFEDSRSKKRISNVDRDVNSFLCLSYQMLTSIQLKPQQLQKKKQEGRRLFSMIARMHSPPPIFRMLEALYSKDYDLKGFLLELATPDQKNFCQKA